MQEAFPGSTIEAPKSAEYHYDILDLDDAHVVHAALLGKADAIVTNDTRAGLETSKTLEAAAIEVLKPHDFAANTVIAHPEAGHRAITQLAARRKRPPATALRLLDDLRTRWKMEEVYELLHPRLADPYG